MSVATLAPKPFEVSGAALDVFERVASMRRMSVDDMLADYVNSFEPQPDYMSDEPLPGEVVCHTPEESRAFLASVIEGAARG